MIEKKQIIILSQFYWSFFNVEKKVKTSYENKFNTV